MKIGIVSDSHGSLPPLLRALDLLRQQNISAVLHCGDIDDAPSILLFAGWTAHFVFGNVDWDRARLRAAAEEVGATFHDPFGDLVLEGVKIAFLHGDDLSLLRDLENAGYYDYIFHGHTHQAAERRVGKTRVINPGALYRARPRTCAALDLATGKLETLVAG
jgi:putative phosphoesterase